MIRKLKDAKIENKNVLLIVDYNTKEINEEGVFKVDQTLKTIEFILKRNPNLLFILTHLGRPKDKTSFSTYPIYEYLKENTKYMKIDIKYIKVSEFDINSNEKIFFGDNSRYYSQEELSQFYSKFDLIINDAFGCSHRKFVSSSIKVYAGLLMEDEIERLGEGMKCDLLILGGAKVLDKIKLIKKFNNKIFLGGGLATSIYKSRGYEVGSGTIQEEVSIEEQNIVLPVDFLVINENNQYFNRRIGEILKNETVVDIGKESIEILKNLVKESKNILWNGPLGKFEDENTKSTKILVECLNNSDSKVVAGGGETVTAIFKYLKNCKFYHISTGGGAMISFLGDEEMPGVLAVTI